MRNLSAEEKAFIWLDAFPLPLGEKNALLKAAGSAVNLVKNYTEFFKNAVKADESGVYNDMAQSLKDDSFFKNVIAALENEAINPVTRVSDGGTIRKRKRGFEKRR